MRSAKILLITLAGFYVLGCERKQPEPSPVETTSAVSSPTPAAPAPAAPAPAAATGEVSWPDPKGWERLKPSNAMRKATYVVPKVGTDPENGELAVFFFGAQQGGDVEANMKRWTEQFKGVSESKVERTTRTAGGMKQDLIEIKDGTFASGMPGQAMTPKDHYALLGAIVETPAGNYFFKLTGPKATVAAAKKSFFELLDNIRYEKSG
jgi:hypothetical protein